MINADVGSPEVDRRTTEGSRFNNVLLPLSLGPTSLADDFNGDRLLDPLPDTLSRLGGDAKCDPP